MIVYNVTIKVSHTVAADWINWLKEEHIADVINTNCFTHATVLRLLDIDEEDGITYAVQYHARNKKLYEEYLEKHADTILLNDLRFGQVIGWQNPAESFAFYFYLQPAIDNTLVVQRGRFAKWNKQSFHSLLTRIKGN